MKKFLLSLVLFCAFGASAQTVTEATQELPNTFQATNQFLVGVDLGPVTFTNLPSSPADGKMIYCSNCQQVTPCIGAGTGAVAQRVAGQWACTAGGGGGGGTSAEFMVNSVDTSSQTVLNFQNANGVTWSNPSAGVIQASISGVIVNPTASQNVVQPTGTQFTANIFENTRYVDASWRFSQSPAADLSSAGAGKTITLTPCPLGIDVSNNVNSPYFVHIATQGTPEEALVTGGTCTSGGASGTIIVTTVNTHAAGYTVSSSTDGVQEAINDAGSPNATVVVPPCTGSATCYNIRSTVYLKSNRMTLSMYGAHFSCLTRGPCFFLGDRGGALTNHKFLGGRFAAGVNVDGIQITNTVSTTGAYTVTTNGSHSFVTGDYVFVEWYQANAAQHAIVQVTGTTSNTFTYSLGSATVSTASAVGWAALEAAPIEDGSNAAVIRDVGFTSVGSPNKFHFGIVVNNDQAAVLDHISNEGSGNVFRCTANFCGAEVLGRSDSSSSGVIYLKNSELSMQCGGNGVLDYSGNSLHISDTVIQGFPQYGVYYESGLQGARLTNVYEEAGACTNPFYGLKAAAGIVTHSGQAMQISGPGPIVGEFPSFVASSPGGTRRNYYIVPRSSVFQYGPIMLAGYCLTSGSGTCTIQWPQIPNNLAGTVTYDILVTDATVAPSTGNANSVVLNTAGTCANSVCSFVDTVAAGTAYTTVAQQWAPSLRWWPGSIAISLSSTNVSNSTGTAAGIIADYIPTTAVSGFVSNRGTQGVSLVFQKCNNFPVASWSPMFISCVQGETYSPSVALTLTQKDQASNSPATGLKGRLNFGGAIASPIHVITLSDSNTSKSAAVPNGRPTFDANDVYIGLDQGTNVAANMGLSLGAPVSVSHYIGNTGDNSAWLERLTATALNIKVTTTVNDGTGGVKFTGPFGGCVATADATLDRLCFDSLGDLAFFKKNGTIARKVVPQDYIFSALPAANSVETGQLAIITDASTSSCPVTTGGGGVRVLVRSNGTTWDCVSGSGGGTAIPVSLFSGLPSSPVNNQLAIVSDWTGSCPVTSGSGTQLHEKLVIWNSGSSRWDCVADGFLPFITTAQAWDGTGLGGLHLTQASTDTNTTDAGAIFPNVAGSLLRYLDFAGPPGNMWHIGMWASTIGVPNGSSKKCLDVDSSSHINFTTGDCLNNPMTLLGDTIYGGSGGAGISGAPTRLAGPTSTNGVPQFYQSTPAAGLATAPFWGPFTIVPNAQTGTTYTFLATDRAGYESFSNAGAIAVTLPQAGTAGFASNFSTIACTIGAGTATITPTTSTISYTTGSGYTSGAANLALSTGKCAHIISDNTNYFAIVWQAGTGLSDPGSGMVASNGSGSTFARTITGTTNRIVVTQGGGVSGNPTIDIGSNVSAKVGTPSDVTAQSASQGTVTIATAPAAGFYIVSYYADVNTQCTTGSNAVSFTFTWTDATGTRTLVTGSMPMAQGGSVVSSYLSGLLPVFISSGNVSYTSTVTGACTSGTSSYDIHAVLRQ